MCPRALWGFVPLLSLLVFATVKLRAHGDGEAPINPPTLSDAECEVELSRDGFESLRRSGRFDVMARGKVFSCRAHSKSAIYKGQTPCGARVITKESVQGYPQEDYKVAINECFFLAKAHEAAARLGKCDDCFPWPFFWEDSGLSGRPACYMEFLETVPQDKGPDAAAEPVTLEQVLSEGGTTRKAARRFQRTLSRVLDVLEVLQAAGIRHRDMLPQNWLVVTSRPPIGKPRGASAQPPPPPPEGARAGMVAVRQRPYWRLVLFDFGWAESPRERPDRRPVSIRKKVLGSYIRPPDALEQGFDDFYAVCRLLQKLLGEGTPAARARYEWVRPMAEAMAAPHAAQRERRVPRLRALLALGLRPALAAAPAAAAAAPRGGTDDSDDEDDPPGTAATCNPSPAVGGGRGGGLSFRKAADGAGGARAVVAAGGEVVLWVGAGGEVRQAPGTGGTGAAALALTQIKLGFIKAALPHFRGRHVLEVTPAPSAAHPSEFAPGLAALLAATRGGAARASALLASPPEDVEAVRAACGGQVGVQAAPGGDLSSVGGPGEVRDVVVAMGGLGAVYGCQQYGGLLRAAVAHWSSLAREALLVEFAPDASRAPTGGHMGAFTRQIIAFQGILSTYFPHWELLASSGGELTGMKGSQAGMSGGGGGQRLLYLAIKRPTKDQVACNLPDA